MSKMIEWRPPGWENPYPENAYPLQFSGGSGYIHSVEHKAFEAGADAMLNYLLEHPEELLKVGGFDYLGECEVK